ncbi:MAG: SdrD B-like domain-containing protein [Anaerolineales bacterium]|nr:MAG: SdrD B-like domain-containing protein [Anaerolineales bacterium]
MRRFVSIAILLTALASCTPSKDSFNPITPTATTTSHPPTQTTTASPTFTATPQPHRSTIHLGPNQTDFPPGINPLTGQEVFDPSLLELPAVLVSISNMPVTARPQAGPAFAPWIFEFYIGEGSTRFMGVFYGDNLREIPNVTGGCKVRDEIIHPQGAWIGNRIWLDENANGVQESWEAGVGGVCVRLLDATSRNVLSETMTDSNGYFAFENPHVDSIIQITKPESYQFTLQNVGDEDSDSDADAGGEIKVPAGESTVPYFDAGFVLNQTPTMTPSPVVTGTPPNWFFPFEPYIGPVRSGRLTYNQIGGMFPNSCLVYASAAYDIGEQLDACEIVYGVDKTTPNSALLTRTRLRELAREALNPRQPVNYSGNVFSESIPSDGRAANVIKVFYNSFTQSGWQYDPVSQSYLRWTDQADQTGNLFPATDRLTGRQMAFENVIVLFAEHSRYRHNQLEILLGPGQKGLAYLFRDGQAFRIQWSTLNREWEKTTGLLRPIYFVDSFNNPIPLRPGRTWIHLVTPFSGVSETNLGEWLVKFVQPLDPLDTPSP